ncbi:MAG: hypothetical protein HC945_04030 [Nitrosarchaeum sp.]|nr:hypothetical protein [Nitrosarchaeum sp.]
MMPDRVDEWFRPDLGKVRFEFFAAGILPRVAPITQSYGVLFTREGKAVIGRQDGWSRPGGRIEEGEIGPHILELALKEFKNWRI